MKMIKEMISKNNYLLGKILGAIGTIAILLLIVALVSTGENGTTEQKITTTEDFYVAVDGKEENTTSKNMVENNTTEETSEEETTLLMDEEVKKEEVITQSVTDEDKEITSTEAVTAKKEAETTKATTTKTETTTQSQTTKIETTKPETSAEEQTTKAETTTQNQTTKSETTTQSQTTKTEITTQEQTTKTETTTQTEMTTVKETTTEEQTTEDESKVIRLTDYEDDVINLRINWFKFFSNESIYKSKEGMYNPHLVYRENGWDSVGIMPYSVFDPGDEYYEGDYFDVNCSDRNERSFSRDLNWRWKYHEAIIKECEDWIKNPSKYGDAEDFGKYLAARYTKDGSESMFSDSVSSNPNGSADDMYEGKKKEWCEKWCYYDTEHKKYKTLFKTYKDFESYIFVKEGCLKEPWEIVSSVDNKYTVSVGACYCRWFYDEETDTTTVYLMQASHVKR